MGDDTPGYERVGRLIYGLQRICGGADRLRALPVHDVSAATVAQDKLLAARYDALYARALRDADSLTDVEVDALLADAQALEGEGRAG